jgi:hypothetical protein
MKPPPTGTDSCLSANDSCGASAAIEKTPGINGMVNANDNCLIKSFLFIAVQSIQKTSVKRLICG